MTDYSPLFKHAHSATIAPVPRGAEPFALAELKKASGSRPVVYIALDDRELDAVEGVLAYIAPNTPRITLPAWDCLPYDRSSPNHSVTAERVSAMAQLCAAEKPFILLTTVNASLQRMPPCKMMEHAIFELTVGTRIDRDALLQFLARNGYTRLSKAVEPGEFAVRGDIIDIFPPGFDEGIRLDFFDDELESIRTYDALSQTTTGQRKDVILHTMSEYRLDADSIERFRTRYRELFGAITKEDPLYEAVSTGQHYPGMEHWLPLLHEKMETLFDYAPEGSIFCLSPEAQSAMAERVELTQDYYQARITGERTKGNLSAVYHPLPPDALYLDAEEWKRALGYVSHGIFSPFKQEEARSADRASPEPASLQNQEILQEAKRKTLIATDMKPSRNFSAERAQAPTEVFNALKAYAGLLETYPKPLILACYSTGSRERIRQLLSDNGLAPSMANSWRDATRTKAPQIALVELPLEHGVELEHVCVLTEQDLLGDRMIRRAKKKRKSDAFIDEAGSLTPGELVVHDEHGIGRFEGLITLDVQGAAHDCLKLVYAGDDKLFIPVENIEVLSRFGAEGEEVALDKLGGVAWQHRKAKMKERIKMAAEELLRIAAERAINQAPVLAPPAGLYQEFAARFPYVETDDQDRSINEALEDLASGRPTDRLVCGDVGFGKTEVAMRAAFATVMAEGASSQVAVVAPTTLLARQHYANFIERFAGLPVTIRQLSRLVPTREATQTRAKLKDGTCDIVIGTHALLSKSIEFKNLGLMIVDEEQHFGVKQKERLKNLKSNVHVLTLSATPIPRTLQLALTGVRELSLITTPPVDRLAVRTFVMPFDGVVLGEAIARERHRGGRVFYVVPRIKDLEEVERAIRAMAPEAKMVVAHGQLPPAQLDQIMQDFYEGKYDVLLSTAIIESGLDVPTANTMIVHRADRFGLSQLYQLRGRVGRGKVRAYTYFTLPHGKTLTKQAMQRLEVMQKLDTLGAGFSLASHDMNIRGFGNLLGEEQSGHVREVGVELYQHMFEEAVKNAKHASAAKQLGEAAQPEEDSWTPQINLGISVLIPEAYVPDLQLRLGLYRRMGYLRTDEEIDAFAVELIDRFGSLPEETKHLLDVLKIKRLCREAGVERVDVGPKGAVLTFRNNSFAKPDKLITYITQHAASMKLRGDQKLVLVRDWKPEAQWRINQLSESLGEIAGLAA